MADQVSSSTSDVIQPIRSQGQPMEQLQTSYRYSDVLIKMRREATQHRLLHSVQQQQDQPMAQEHNLHPVGFEAGFDLENQHEQVPDNQFPNAQATDHQVARVPLNVPRATNEKWFDFAKKASDGWPQRRWNILINLLASLLVFTNQAQNCGIPLSNWISIYLLFLCSDIWLQEFRDRLSNSYYWHTDHRKLRKAFSNSTIILSEIVQQIWFVYGSMLYFSQDAKDCSKDNGSMMVGMLIFLILGLLKFFLILFIVFFVIYVIVYRRLKRRSERSMSLLVINSLSRVKFSALLNQGEPDEECVICFNEYKDEDIVSRLDCNQKHMFHEECLRSWISQGKNSCPICRAPINSGVQL